MTSTLSYDLGGHRLAVFAANEALLARFDRSYAAFRLEDPKGDAGFRLDLVEGELPMPPAGFVLTFDGILPYDGPCRSYAAGERVHLLYGDDCALEIDRDRHYARITVAPGRTECMRGTISILAMEAAADSDNQVLMHAAGLTPPGDDSRCFLIHAPSGVGKTTTSLALVRSGFRLCSDDAVFTRVDGAGVSAWGLPAAPKVHRHTVALMPWLAPMLAGAWSSEDERPVRWQTLADGGFTRDRTPRPVAALFRLARAGDGRTAIAPVARADILTSLAADNLRQSRAGLLPLQRRRFAMLTRLATTCPVYELRAGSDIDRLADVVAARMRDVP